MRILHPNIVKTHFVSAFHPRKAVADRLFYNLKPAVRPLLYRGVKGYLV
jgi:hypothetical protein